MSGFDMFLSEQRRRAEEARLFDERLSRGQSPLFRGGDSASQTIMLRALPSGVNERDVRRALENDRANYTDVRLVRDKKSGKLNAFVDFVSIADARQFMRDCRGEIEIRKSIIRMIYSTSKERREDDRFEEPSSTIMLRGIPSSMDHRDVRDALDDARVNYVDVRVIKDKNTGATKGFGFVDFASVHEAMRWMEYQKGYLRVRRHELRLTYSTPRGVPDTPDPSMAPGLLGPSTFMCRPAPLSEVSTGDWICSRCSSHNFRRREQCYKCQLPRSQVQSLANSVDGVDLIGTTPCNTLVLRCLDALTTEDDICKVFEDTADVKVRQCHVMRDEITHVSRCFAFAELPSVADAYKVMDIVSKEYKLFEIGGKAVTISYAKNTFNTIMATLKTEGSYNAQLNSSRNLAVDLAQVAMAAQSSNINPDTVAVNAVAASALLSQSITCGPAIAHAAIQQKQTEQHVISALAKSMRNSTEHIQVASTGYAPSMATLAATGQTLPPPSVPFNAATAATTVFPYPDTSKYIYDESTRFYYDPVTGLLYEPNSKYFYDRATVRYYYWDQTRSTYFPVPQQTPEQPAKQESTGNTDQSTTSSNQASTEGKEPVVRPSKGKSAQQIAKEMEKWAKRMNAQKKNPLVTSQRTESNNNENSRTADTCYALLEAATSSAANAERAAIETTTINSPYHVVDTSEDIVASDTGRNTTLNDVELEEEGKVADEEAKLVDWVKLACLLCSRGFKDAATLQKHRSFSSLHIENLNKLRAKHGLRPVPIPTSTDSSASSTNTVSIASLMQIGAQAASDHAKTVAARQGPGGRVVSNSQYRDRAKERREKYGIPSPPVPRYMDNPPPAAATIQPPMEPAVPAGGSLGAMPPPSGPNVGSRLMEKMGWQAGQGLGRANQGRTQIVEAEFREQGVGLGIKTSKRGPPSDNYKDNVKRAMFARFHELE